MLRRDLGKILGILLALFGTLGAAERESVSVEDAFWAYDDGKIGEEDLEELLRLIEAGDGEEACAEWEALGLEPCEKSLDGTLRRLEFSRSVSRGSFFGFRGESAESADAPCSWTVADLWRSTS